MSTGVIESTTGVDPGRPKWSRTRKCAATIAGVLAAIVFQITVHQAEAQEKTEWRRKFLEEAPLAWKAYRAKSARIQGTVVGSISLLPNKMPLSEMNLTIKQRDGYLLWSSQEKTFDRNSGSLVSDEGNVESINPKYGFKLEREGDEPWAVSGVVSQRDALDKFRADAVTTIDFYKALPVSFQLIRGRYDDLPSSPEFEVVSVASVGEDPTIRVTFDYDPKDKSKPRLFGWMEYLPRYSWVIHRFDVQMQFRGTVEKITKYSAEYEYDFADAGFPLLRSITQLISSPSENYNVELTKSFDLEIASPDEDDFTLSAFGFPELGEKPARKPPLFLGFGGIGALLIGIACVLKLRSAKRSRAIGS